MIIDDLMAVVESARAVTPLPDGSYIVIWHPDQVRDLRHVEARHRYYWNRWVERYNRRAERLGLAPLNPDYEGEVGSIFGTKIVEDA